MALVGNDNAEKIWNFLMSKIGNSYGVAGLMGNLKAESGLNPKNLQNSYEKKLGMNDEQYTNNVDCGSYINFTKDSAGYGLAQWTYSSRKQNLYVYAKQVKKTSIGDLETQLEFLIKELSSSYKSVFNALKNAGSIYDASTIVLTQFEKPANQGDSVKNTRCTYGQEYYNKFASKKSIDEIAKEVIAGKWDVAPKRKLLLEAAGYNYEAVQQRVNELCNNSIKYYPAYSGNTNSIVQALMAVGCKDTTLTFRKKIANKNDISNYSGTAKQNTLMLKLLKAGKLIQP